MIDNQHRETYAWLLNWVRHIRDKPEEMLFVHYQNAEAVLEEEISELVVCKVCAARGEEYCLITVGSVSRVRKRYHKNRNDQLKKYGVRV